MADMLNHILTKDQSGVEIVVQNHRKHATALEAAEVIRKVNNSRLGLVFSMEHCIGENEDIQEVYKAIKPITKQLYIADVKLSESGLVDILPGKGDVPIKEVYSLMGGNDFKGWVTFKWEKIWRRELEEPEIALPYFIDYFSKLSQSI